MMVKAWAKNNDVKLQILRLSHIYGPADRRRYTIPIWLQAAGRNEPIRLFVNPSMYRNCLYIDDCCRAILRAVTLETSAGVINTVSKHTATMLEIARLCKEVSHNPYEIEIRDPCSDLKKETGLRFKNNNKFRELLGGEAVSLYEGLEREFEYYRKK